MFKRVWICRVLALLMLIFTSSPSYGIDLNWIICEICPEAPEVDIIDNTIIMGNVRDEEELLNVSVHGAAALLPPATSYLVSIQYDLNSWDSYNQLTDEGTGFWDSFSVSITEAPYWHLSLIDPITTEQISGLGFVWGGTVYGDGILESTSGMETFVLPGDPSRTNYLNIVLDTKTLPESNHAYPSWGTITVEVSKEGIPGDPNGGGIIPPGHSDLQPNPGPKQERLSLTHDSTTDFSVLIPHIITVHSTPDEITADITISNNWKAWYLVELGAVGGAGNNLPEHFFLGPGEKQTFRATFRDGESLIFFADATTDEEDPRIAAIYGAEILWRTFFGSPMPQNLVLFAVEFGGAIADNPLPRLFFSALNGDIPGILGSIEEIRGDPFLSTQLSALGIPIDKLSILAVARRIFRVLEFIVDEYIASFKFPNDTLIIEASAP